MIYLDPKKDKDPVIQEAFDVSVQSDSNKKNLEAYDRYLDAIRSSASQLDTAYDRGVQEGLQEGAHKKALEIAQQLLEIVDVATIAKKTGLRVEEVEQLKKINN